MVEGSKKRKEEYEEEGEPTISTIVPRDWFFEPWELFKTLEREFDTLRQNLEREFFAPVLSRAPWKYAPLTTRMYRSATTGIREPLMDIEDKGKEVVIKAELPGIPKDAIDINLTTDSIEISAKAGTDIERREEGYYHRERTYKSFYRKMSLPTEVVPDKADASLNHGVLEIRIPKVKPVEPKKVHKINIK